MPSDIEDRPVAAAVLSYIATRGFDRSLVGPGHVLRFQIFDYNGAIGLRSAATALEQANIAIQQRHGLGAELGHMLWLRQWS